MAFSHYQIFTKTEFELMPRNEYITKLLSDKIC